VSKAAYRSGHLDKQPSTVRVKPGSAGSFLTAVGGANHYATATGKGSVVLQYLFIYKCISGFVALVCF